ncbi:MAG: hypothetical protein [Bacteriophage sp.]|nr:MAG: hypothetical protein [Bacteriophage sp.]
MPSNLANYPKQQNKIIIPPDGIKPGNDAGLSYLGKQAAADPVLSAWGSWLDQREWQLFTTLTTGRELTLPGARRSVNKLASYLKENGYPAEIFWAAEPFDLKEGYHLHSLIRFADLERSDDNKPAYNYLVNGWRQITSDKTARIHSRRYDPGKGANHYVGKYISKTRSDYDIISPGIINDDQIEDRGIFQDSLEDYKKKRDEELKKHQRRQIVFSNLLEIGINSAQKPQDLPKYESKDITYKQWEEADYKANLHGLILNKIGLPQFKMIRN